MCTSSVNELIGVTEMIFQERNRRVSWLLSLEGRVSDLTNKVQECFGYSSLQAEFAIEVLNFVRMSKLVPLEHSLYEWLQFGIPNVIESIKNKISLINRDNFRIAI